MKAEIFARGPISCGVNAEPLLNYTGGIISAPHEDKGVNHIISVIGWGYDETGDRQFWIVRNSWGEYYGEMGYFRIEMGNNELGIESECAWVTPSTFTETNFPCFEDGSNCVGEYVDPSDDLAALEERLLKAA